jgi:4-amino-4-deoxy-L-arabinose transferase-like glycosyltransferase
MLTTLAYRPFLDPLPIAPYWLMLMPPMAIAVAVVYKTVRVHNLADLPRQATVLSLQIIVFMVLAAAALWLLTELA